jgi:long-chain acyl-CoA synthetase
VDKSFSSMLKFFSGQVPSLRKVVYLTDDVLPEGCDVFFESLAATSSMEDMLRGGNDVAGIFYTGGTTGRAKGVMLTHANLVVNALGNNRTWTEDDRYLHGAPMFHLANGVGMLSATYVGGCHVFIPAFAPDAFLNAISEHHVTRAMAVPAMIAAMVSLPTLSKMQLSSLRQLTYGASPMSETLLKEAMAAFPNAEFLQGYGMTECAPGITNLDWKYHRGPGARLRSVGKPASYVEVKIVDSDDREVPRGTVGEVVVRGPNVMKGYFKNRSATEEALRGGWMHTGDGAYMDEEGFVYLVDRIKDMIITGGENVYSAEVENVVMSFPGVLLCAVIGIPDAKLGELVTAVVQPKQGASVDEKALQDHCRAHIASYKIPRKVIIKETLPMSGAGKVLKAELRKPFWTGSDSGGRSSKL